MVTHPTEVELVRYVEGDLSATRSERIRRMSESDPSLAEVIERIRADLTLAPQLREAVGDAESLSTENKIEAALTKSVTQVRETHGGKG
jgi:anti-sigma factor RsiW